jgi:hypothetical protein
MSIYRINPIGGGNGFKVHVADEAGGLRVVGIFFSETDAEVWIATDRNQSKRNDGDATAWKRASHV